MENEYMILELSQKGKHPGEVLLEIIIERNISQRFLSQIVGEFPQTLWAIIKKKRSMNVELAYKIEQCLQLPQGYLMTLQLFYDIEQIKLRENGITNQ